MTLPEQGFEWFLENRKQVKFCRWNKGRWGDSQKCTEAAAVDMEAILPSPAPVKLQTPDHSGKGAESS